MFVQWLRVVACQSKSYKNFLLSHMAKKQQAERKQILITLPIGLHGQFKDIAKARGESMRSVIMQAIRAYVRKHSAKAGGAE